MKLFKIKNSPVWYVTIGSGKNRIQKSTGQTDYNEARRVASELAAVALMCDDAARVSAVSAMVSKKMESANGMTAGRLLLSSLSSADTDKYGRPLKPSTMRLKQDMWRAFVRFAESRGVSTVGAVTSELGEAFFKRAGIVGDNQQYCAHCLRTTFASKCAVAGVPL